MKKLLILSIFLSFFAITSTALAQGFVPLAPISGLTDPTSATSVVNSSSFANFFNNLYKYCIGLSAVLAVIMIIWGGLEYATQDVPGSKQNGKEKIQQAILGLILVLSPVLVFSIINPRILNLSIGITPLVGVGSFVGAPVQLGTAPAQSVIQSDFTRTCNQYTGITAILRSSSQTCESFSPPKENIDMTCCATGNSNTFARCCGVLR